MKLKRPNAAKPAVKKARPVARVLLRNKSFPIVGVGSSAGGLEAFTEFLQHLPVDTGMAYILVQHLDPEHESALPRILGRATTMPVHEAGQGMRVEPNHIYVIPPNSTLRLSRGRLDLKPREPSRAPHLSIDSFFKSLAEERHEGAIGVVFSGNATDGTLGLEAIKAAGGITFAQDTSARYDSMPRSAIASGCVDHVMAPAAVAVELARIAAHPYLNGQLSPLPADAIALRTLDGVAPTSPSARLLPSTMGVRGRTPAPLGGFAKIMELMREQSGVHFSLYKPSTIHRRITRRMVLGRKNSLDDYADFLAADAKEFKALYADLLINVTSFFRDEAAFEALKKVAFPRLIAEKRSGPVRMWSIGCSSGQEAYSLGMAFIEATEKLADRAPKLQIFGTDLNEALLNKARHGLYPKNVADEVSPERLRRFFVEEDGGYRVIKALREVCIFARQDLLSDPPFSRMDLVSCRNVLIYLEQVAQKRILPMLHYALKPEGFLFLGTSETVGSFPDLFEPLDKKQKLFARKSAATPAFSLPLRDRRKPAATRAGPRPPQVEEALRTEVHAQQESDRITVNLFAPPGVLVDANLNVVQFRGATEAYLAPSSGKASFNLLKMAREGLLMPLRSAIDQARKQNETARREKVRFGNSQSGSINLRVVPLKNLPDRYFLVLFEESGGRTVSAPAPAPPEKGGDRALRLRNAELERELRETRDYVQSLQQQHDTANDELQASNEEVQSTNEELQSINEELETSKEELESGNEELITVNEEMAYRNGELSRLNSDLNNFHVSISTPIVVLGRDLTIRRFTPLAEKMFNLLATDIGRPIGGIKHNLQLEDLEGFVRKVIDLLAARESEVRDKDGHWYLLRARPYLTVDNKVDGAVLVLLDIDALKHSEQAITQERNYAEATLRTARDPLVILRPDLTINTANDAFYRVFELTPAQTENRTLYELADGAWNIPALRTLLADVLPRNHFFNDLEVTHRFGALGDRTMLLNGRRLETDEGAPLRILLSIEDITERRRSSAALRASEVRYRRLFEAAKDGVLILDPDTRRITDANPFMVQLLGYRRDEFLEKELFEIGLFRDEQASQEAFLHLRKNQEIRYEDLPLKGKDGKVHEVEVVANLYDEGGRAVIQCNIRDITDRKRMGNALRASEKRYRSLFDSIDEGFCILEMIFDEQGKAVDYRFEEVNPSFESQAGLSHVVGKRIRELVPGIETTWLEIYGRVAETGRPIRQTGEFKALNRWFEVFCFPVGARSPRKVAVLFTDVTERKKLQAALEASESYFRELTESMPVGVWTSLPDGRIDFINRHWLKYTGQALDDSTLSPDTWLNAVHPDDRKRLQELASASRVTGNEYSLEVRFRDAATGQYRWFFKHSVPVRDTAGRVQKRIGVCIDVDDQKRAQKLLEDHAGDLEAQVQARTGELRETVSELEAFSYSVSHDMRAPLRAMHGFAQLLLKKHEAALDSTSLDQLRRINTSAARLDTLIADVLAYAGLIRSKIILTSVPLEELVRRVIATYPQLQANEAVITIDDVLPAVLANEASLTQVISNLLTNAVKFVAPGAKAVVHVRAEEVDGEIRLWIEDNGIGIDPRDHARIWTMFTRVVRAKDYEGTGIGLAIVRKAAERMGGTIGVDSTLGHGSRFWLQLRKG